MYKLAFTFVSLKAVFVHVLADDTTVVDFVRFSLYLYILFHKNGADLDMLNFIWNLTWIRDNNNENL